MIHKKIIPERIIYQNKIYKITKINPNYIIDIYTLFLNKNNQLIEVKLDADHCNADPYTDLFCLSSNIKFKKLSGDLIKTIESLIRTYNLNNCYFSPWKFIEYEPYDHKEYKQKIEKNENSILNKISNFFNFCKLEI